MPRWLLLLFLGLAACTPVPETGHTVTFAIDMRPAMEAGWFDPATDSVGIRGSVAPLSWGETLAATDADGDGVYEATVAFAEDSATVGYKFKVDGDDGNPNGGWENGRNRLVTVAAQPVQVARAFDEEPPPLPRTFTGDIRLHEDFASDHVATRDLLVYLPPGYDDAPDRHYPVLYLHDGQNIFDASDMGMEWQMDEAAERLIRAGAIEPVILVGLSNTAARTDEYTPTRFTMTQTFTRNMPAAGSQVRDFVGTYVQGENTATVERSDDGLVLRLGSLNLPLAEDGPDTFTHAPRQLRLRFDRDENSAVTQMRVETPSRGGQGDAYGRFLVEEAKPFIDATYRTLPEASHTALGGSSLGGLITLYLGHKYPGTFGQLLVVSPSIWWDDRFLLRQTQNLAEKTDQRIWLDMGTAEGETALPNARALRDALVAQGWEEGIDLVYVEAENARHDETAWAARAPEMLRFLYGR